MKTNLLEKLFRYISDTINGAERSLLDLLSAIVPYTTASIPAYLTYTHTYEYMDFPIRIAWLAAFTVEVLGVTAVSTSIRFWQWNSTHKSNAEKAPFFLAVSTYAFYILIVLSVNVILEVYAGVRAPAVIWAIGLFSLLSIPSGVLISVRAQFGEMLEDKRLKAEQRRQERKQMRRPWVQPQPLPLSAETDGPGELEESPRQGGLFRRRKQRS